MNKLFDNQDIMYEICKYLSYNDVTMLYRIFDKPIPVNIIDYQNDKWYAFTCCLDEECKITCMDCGLDLSYEIWYSLDKNYIKCRCKKRRYWYK